ncbi:MAG: response regulator, partial [Nitrospirae bacterium]|nr:response regulator [Nitrospirota bacterium]
IRAGKYARISISDQGPGIEETLIESIFEPFFTTKHRGSGLGLTTSFSIIQSHDGYITVESEPGCGTKFHIYLPAATEVSPNAGEGKRFKIGHKKVLIMDDDELVRTVLERMLNQCNCSSDFSGNGEEMLAKYREAKEAGQPFDIVIMDLIISAGMGGRDAIKALLELDPSARVIVSSGYSDDRIMANFREYGFMASLPKPYLISSLSKALNDVITASD